MQDADTGLNRENTLRAVAQQAVDETPGVTAEIGADLTDHADIECHERGGKFVSATRDVFG
ncbi:hypothetical protein YTPLAS18_12610 [Nitrospira sp.]|nr:hypothetical protein YTPLAS18_12610 [Nitrospira sp.]